VDVRVGISGWRYAGWRGKFYPEGLPQKQDLAYAVGCFLRRHKIGLVVADTAGKWPLMEDVTADFVCVRLHGDKKTYERLLRRRA
jgi:uncharacterized protein YecE (DUF72 family)